MRNSHQRINQTSTGFVCSDNQTLVDHAYEAEITRSQRPKLIKVALMQELRDAARMGKRRCRRIVKSAIFEVASSASRSLDKLAQKVSMDSEAINHSGLRAKYKSS